jgi:hypothetical protein
MIPLPNEFVRPPFAYTLSGHRDGLSFTANDRRALYRPHWVALEGLDGQRLQERYAATATFRGHMKATAWDDLQLAHYCGYLIWNYVAVPFMLADSDVVTEELEPGDVHGEIWRRLKVELPQRQRFCSC